MSIRNKGGWSTYTYYEDHVTISQPPGEKKTTVCAKMWADEFDKNLLKTVKFDDLDALQAEIDAARRFKWTNPYKW